MRRGIAFLPVAVLVCACAEYGPESIETTTPELRTAEQEVVYGEDDRTDYYAHPDEALRQLTAQSIVAMISANTIQVSGNNVTLRTRTLGQSYNLCDDERFGDQPTAASCSGTLIDDNLVLTAGHCVQGGCGNNRWVFNYYYEGEGDLHALTLDDVFECERVVAQSVPSFRGDDPDYAIVQLDRSATPRFQPAEFNPEVWPVGVGDAVSMIGFGSGIPAKIDDGGVVLDERRSARTYFRATTDAFGGNSGSGVFDEQNRVVGILVAGEQDYTNDGGCTRVAVLPENGGSQGGESVTYAILAVEELCDGGWPSQRLCGIAAECGDGICSLGESFEGCPADCEENNTGGWTCDPSYFAARDGCDCDCGAYDPDCEDPRQEIFNCRAGQICSGAGVCAGETEPEPEPGIPADWLCEADTYDAADGCDCDCGTYDPDCDDPGQDIYNCAPGEWCIEPGICVGEGDPGVIPPNPGTDTDSGNGFDGFGDIIPSGTSKGDGCSAANRRNTAPWLGLAALALLRRKLRPCAE